MARATWFRATALAFSFWFLTSLPPLWDALVALVLDTQTEDSAAPPPSDDSTDGSDSDRSAALDPLG